MNKRIISKFLSPLNFKGVELEFCSGKIETLSKAKATYDYTSSGLILSFDLNEYYLSFIYDRLNDNAFTVKAVATPKTAIVNDKIRKITSLKGFLKFSKSALIVKQNFIDSKIIEREKDEKFAISVDFLSVYEKNSVDNALSFVANTRSKFYTEIA